MRFKVADLIKSSPGTQRWVEIDEPDMGDHQDFKVVAPLRGNLRLMRDPAGILVEGDLETEVEVCCSRCLEPFRHGVALELEEHFRPAVVIEGGATILSDPDEDADPATEIDRQQVLDLTAVLWQNLELVLPVHLLCREDCRGLCSRCGHNLNLGDCSCEAEPDPRWAALSDRLRSGSIPK